MKFLAAFFVLALACGRDENPGGSELALEKISWKYEDDFSAANKELIKSSVNVLRRRLNSDDVWTCTRENYKRWKVRNSGQDIDTTQKFRSWNREHQTAFRNAVTASIRFKAYSENSDSMGRAFVGGFVKANIVPGLSLVPMYELQGEFEVSLNKHRLNDKEWNDKDIWAGVIAHEMLHQMGYAHEDNNYTDNMFITVFGDCVQSDGVFSDRAGLGLNSGKPFPIPD